MSSETLSLAQLGLDQEELQQRLVEAVVQALMTDECRDDDSDSYSCASRFARCLQQKLEEAIAGRVEAVAQEHIVPRVGELIENVTLQRTNEWGEKTSEAMTFTRYLVERAEAYLTEIVDMDGNPKGHDRYYAAGGSKQTRLAWLVDRHLQFGIKIAMTEAVKNANEVLAGALAETARIKLAEIAKSLRVNVQI